MYTKEYYFSLFIPFVFIFSTSIFGEGMKFKIIQQPQNEIENAVKGYADTDYMYRNNRFLSSRFHATGGSGIYVWCQDGKPNSLAFLRKNIATGETIAFDAPHILSNEARVRNIPAMTPPPKLAFIVSPDDRYVVILVSGRYSALYDTANHSFDEVSRSKKQGEMPIGFDGKGNVICAKQGISPTYLTRRVSTGEIVQRYHDARPDDTNDNIHEDPSHDEEGLCFMTPVTSDNGKYTAFLSAASRRDFFKTARLLVCDNESGNVVFKDATSMETANPYLPPIVLFGHDDSRLFFQDGRIGIRCYDLKKQKELKPFVMEKVDNNNRFNSETIKNMLLTPTGNIIVQIYLPNAYFNLNPAVTTLSCDKPYRTTAVWNPTSGKTTFDSPWVIEGYYTLEYWISPDGKTMASFSVPYDPENRFAIAKRKDGAPDLLSFRDLKSGELLYRIEDNITEVQFEPNWSFFDVTFVYATDDGTITGTKDRFVPLNE